MRTTLNLDDRASAGAIAVSGGRTETKVINEPLRRFARSRRRRRLLALRGKAEWEGDLDSLRRRS